MPITNIPIARFRWFVVEKPIYDASNGDQYIDPDHVITMNISRDLQVKPSNIIIEQYNMLVMWKWKIKEYVN